MSDLTAALHARRADLHARIRHHASEIADIDRLLVRHDPGFNPMISQVVIATCAPDLVNRPLTVGVPQNDDRAPADVPHVEPVTVAEAGVDPAPDGLPRPSLDIAETRPTGGRRQTPRPSERGEPNLPCTECERMFPTKQALASHAFAAHGVRRDGGRFTWDYAKVAEVACAAISRGESASEAVRALNPGCTAKAAGVAMVKARKEGHEIPYVRQFADGVRPGPRPSNGAPVRPTMSAVEAAEAAVLDGAA